MVKNAYIHIPFCRSKCNYCSFVSFDSLDLKADYVDALVREIDFYYDGTELNTLYFGGGTPSLLAVDDFEKIISKFSFAREAEVTAEINPEGVTLEYLTALRGLGINRLSIGVQSFDDNILKFIGRRHDSAAAQTAVEYAKMAGFENISLDFIYGLPGQCIEGFAADLRRAVALGVKHVSLYGLKIENNWQPMGLADDDMQADMYLKAIEVLGDFKHYEISNFARSGFESKHNLNYWDNNVYYGFGCAAHGYVSGVRYNNTSDLSEYILKPCSHLKASVISVAERLEEEIFLGFRRGSGIDSELINKKFCMDFGAEYKEVLDKYLQTGHLIKTDVGYRFSNEGFLLSNIILSEFLQ